MEIDEEAMTSCSGLDLFPRPVPCSGYPLYSRKQVKGAVSETAREQLGTTETAGGRILRELQKLKKIRSLP